MKPFTTATLVILALVAIGHALRLLLGWSHEFNYGASDIWPRAGVVLRGGHDQS